MLVTLVLPPSPRPGRLLVVVAGARVAQPSRSDAAGALAADATAWMITGRGGVCIQLIGQLVRPTCRHLRQRGGAAWLARRDVLVILRVSQYFSTSDGPKTARESMFLLNSVLALACRSPSTQWLEDSIPFRLPAEVCPACPPGTAASPGGGLPRSTSSSGRWYDQDWTDHLPVVIDLHCK